MNTVHYIIITILLMVIGGLGVFILTGPSRGTENLALDETPANSTTQDTPPVVEQPVIPADTTPPTQTPAPQNPLDTVAPTELANTSWQWQRTRGPGRSILLTPTGETPFILTLTGDTIGGSTDCNSFSGSYTITGSAFAVGPLASTKMYCPESQESDYLGQIGNIASFTVTSSTLELHLSDDAGTMEFVRTP